MKKKRTGNNHEVQPATGQDVPSAFIRDMDIRVLLYKLIVLYTLRKQLKHLQQNNILLKKRGISCSSNESRVEIVGPK